MPITLNTKTISKDRLSALITKLKDEKRLKEIFNNTDTSTFSPEFPPSTEQIVEVQITPPIQLEDDSHILDKYGNSITLNKKQQSFVSLASDGNSVILIGAAGTGKTTTQRAVVSSLIHKGILGILQNDGHRHLPIGTPGIVICAYTRRAVANIRRNMPTDLQANCITIHKLLEYQPVYNEVTDDEGNTKTKMTFEATRNKLNPLPPSIRCIVFEESSMLGIDLYKEVLSACPHGVQTIFLGDIQQLPPVFGPAILGFKLLELSAIELTEVYRQALESPIISLAHRLLSGKGIPPSEFPEWKKYGQLTIHPWKKQIKWEDALKTLGQFFTAALDRGGYDIEEDVILIPFNKGCGTDELNKIIANHIAKKHSRIVYEIIAGFQQIYLSVGEKVLHDKEDAIVIKIESNPSYTGKRPVPESPTLDYWGYDPVKREKASLTEDEMDFILESVVAGEGEDRTHQASHIVTLRMLDSDQEVKVTKAAELNAMILAYALTVHKSQGSEWRKVFFCLHQSHNTMVSRELLYTAVTRAREELYVICEPDHFMKGIASQRVKGDTLAEKAEYFKGKVDSGYQYQ